MLAKLTNKAMELGLGHYRHGAYGRKTAAEPSTLAIQHHYRITFTGWHFG